MAEEAPSGTTYVSWRESGVAVRPGLARAGHAKSRASAPLRPSPDAVPQVIVEALRVLVVDRQRMFGELLIGRVGDDPGMEVVGLACSAEEALREISRRQPDVAVIDPDLLDAAGEVLVGRIRDASPRTKTVLLTSTSNLATLMSAVNAGCSGFLTKDRPIDELLEAVRAAHRGEVSISPALATLLLPRLRENGGISSPLSRREREVLDLLAEGLSNRGIAERLYVSVNTVRNHVQRVITKLGAHSKLEAVAIGVQAGLVTSRHRPTD